MHQFCAYSQQRKCCWITVNRSVAEVQLEIYWPTYRSLKVVTIKLWFCEKELWSETSVHVIYKCGLCKEGSFSLSVPQVTLKLNTGASYHCVVHTYWTHNHQPAVLKNHTLWKHEHKISKYITMENKHIIHPIPRSAESAFDTVFNTQCTRNRIISHF